MAQDMNDGTTASKTSHATSADRNHAPADRTQAGNPPEALPGQRHSSQEKPHETQGTQHLHRNRRVAHRAPHRGAPRAFACQQVGRLVP